MQLTKSNSTVYTWTDFTNGKQVKIYEDSYTLPSQDYAKYEFNLHFIFSVEAYTCIVFHAKIDPNCTSLVRTYIAINRLWKSPSWL